MEHINQVMVSKALFQRMQEVSNNAPRKDVSEISPVHLHFFESNKMFLDATIGLLMRTHYGQVQCERNELTSFTIEEMHDDKTKDHIKKRIFEITGIPIEKIEIMVDLLQFVFTLRESKIGDGVDYTIYGCHYDPSFVGMTGEKKPVWVVVIDSPTYEDCSDATEWKVRKQTFPFRFAIYSICYPRIFGDGEIIN